MKQSMSLVLMIFSVVSGICRADAFITFDADVVTNENGVKKTTTYQAELALLFFDGEFSSQPKLSGNGVSFHGSLGKT